MGGKAPAPDVATASVPTIAAQGGGGAGGSGSGKKGKKGKNKKKGKGKKGKQDPKTGSKSACKGKGKGKDGGGCPNHHGGKKSGAVSKGDPVDVVTGEVFTSPYEDVELRGPLPFTVERSYRVTARERDVGLGYGWSHSLAWEVVAHRNRTEVWTDDGVKLDFGPAVEHDVGVLGADGWILVRDAAGYVLDFGDGKRLVFAEPQAIAGATRFRLSAIEDVYGNRIALRYERGRLTSVEDSVGRVLRVRLDARDRIASFEMQDGKESGRWVTLFSYVYDEQGDLVRARDALGHGHSYRYDADHKLVSHQNPLGLAFVFRYDDEGRCVETWGEYPNRRDTSLDEGVPTHLADGTTRAKGIYHCKLMFHDDGYSEVTDSVSFHRYFGNDQGKVEKAVSGNGVYSRTYDAYGHLASFTDPVGATTRFERDPRGRELSVTDPVGRKVLITRELDGHIREVVDTGGGVTRVNRTLEGLTWTDPIGAMFEVKYDARGLVTETVAPNGRRTVYTHDAFGNVVETKLHDGSRSSATYDFWGRCTSVTDGMGSTSAFEYDDRGDVVVARAGDGAEIRYVYDGARNVVAVTNPTGVTAHYAYGGLSVLTEVRTPKGTEIKLRYDREGLLVAVYNARGEVHRIERDVAGLPVVEQTFDGRVHRYAYDAVGRLKSEENGLGELTRYEYFLDGKLKLRTFADETTDAFEYHGGGDLAAVRSGDVEVHFDVNAVGWVVRERQSMRGDAVVIETDYDAMGNTVRRKTSRGHDMHVTRDVMGNAQELSLDGERVRLGYDARGLELVRHLPRGGRIETGYDAIGQLAHRRVVAPSVHVPVSPSEPSWIGEQPGGSVVLQTFRYTAASQIAEQWDRRFGIKRFEYDPDGQLLSCLPEKARAEIFTYDATGNLHEPSRGEREYGPGDRLLRQGEKELLWDDAGRLVEARSDGVTTRYHWSARGLLDAVEKPDGTRVEFSYDAYARRMEKRVVRAAGGDTALASRTRFVWDAMTLVHEVRERADDPVVFERTYCFEDDRPVPFAHRDARLEGAEPPRGSWFHYLNDDTGTPEILVATDGTIACDLERSAWGEMRAAEGSTTDTPIRFPGQYADDETGLSYNRYRYYDPSLGRYISPDPLGVYGGPNAYMYAGNAPTFAVDVDGLMKSVIKKDGVPIFSGTKSSGSPDPALPSKKACAETMALTAMAQDIRKKNPGISDEGVRAEIKKQFKDGKLTIETTEKEGRNIIPRNPCDKCAAQFKELGIEDHVLAPNKGKKLEKWDKKSTHP